MALVWDDCGGAIWAPTVACDRVELVGERQQLVATDIRIWRKAPVGLRALFFSLQTSLPNCTPSFKAGGCGSLRLLAFPLLLCKRVCPYVLSAPRICPFNRRWASAPVPPLVPDLLLLRSHYH